jgi:hypothetical protein
MPFASYKVSRDNDGFFLVTAMFLARPFWILLTLPDDLKSDQLNHRDLYSYIRILLLFTINFHMIYSISHKSTLLSRRFSLCPLLFQYMDVYCHVYNLFSG